MSVKITSLSPNGSFQSGEKTLYSFSVTLSDGQKGNIVDVRSESRNKVGDWVECKVMGAFKGVNKLQLNKAAPGEEPEPQARPQTNARAEQKSREEAAFGQSAPAKSPGQIHPATVGMAVKEALGLISRSGVAPNHPDFFPAVDEIASSIIRLSLRLESGDLYPVGLPPKGPQGSDESDVPY